MKWRKEKVFSKWKAHYVNIAIELLESKEFNSVILDFEQDLSGAFDNTASAALFIREWISEKIDLEADYPGVSIAVGVISDRVILEKEENGRFRR